MSTMPVSFQNDIFPLFRNKDVICMDPLRVRLRDYDYMSDQTGDQEYSDHANANHVYARLVGNETPRMPAGGPYWTEENLNLFKKWMTDGYQP